MRDVRREKKRRKETKTRRRQGQIETENIQELESGELRKEGRGHRRQPAGLNLADGTGERTLNKQPAQAHTHTHTQT